MSIEKNIEKIKLGLKKDTVLVCVSKYHTPEEIKEAYDFGERDFGENKVQDLVKKQELLPKDIKWHLIGHLQTNKVKYIVGKTYLIHSLDSIPLADEINKRYEKENLVCDCLIQINSTGIESRFGVAPEDAVSFAREMKKYPCIKIKGIMGMAPICDNPELNFRLLKNIFDSLKKENLMDGNILSMGMSGDYEAALSEGSNMVRIGSKIFN